MIGLSRSCHDTRMDDSERGAVRVWAWLLWMMTAGIWFAEMSAIGYSKPAHDDADPVSAAAYNHQQNMAWAYHVFWMVVIPPVAALIGGALVERRERREGRGRRPGRRALGGAFGAFLATVVIGGYGVYQGLANMRFVF
jgi:hypothetical protein